MREETASNKTGLFSLQAAQVMLKDTKAKQYNAKQL